MILWWSKARTGQRHLLPGLSTGVVWGGRAGGVPTVPIRLRTLPGVYGTARTLPGMFGNKPGG